MNIQNTNTGLTANDWIMFGDGLKVRIQSIERNCAILAHAENIKPTKKRTSPQVFNFSDVHSLIKATQGLLLHGDVLGSAIVDINPDTKILTLIEIQNLTVPEQVSNRLQNSFRYFLHLHPQVRINAGQDDIVYDFVLHPKIQPLVKQKSAVFHKFNYMWHFEIERCYLQILIFPGLYQGDRKDPKAFFEKYPDPFDMEIDDEETIEWNDIVEFNKQIMKQLRMTKPRSADKTLNQVRAQFKVKGLLSIDGIKGAKRYDYKLASKMFTTALPSDKWTVVARNGLIVFKGPENELKKLLSKLKKIDITWEEY